VDDSGAPCAFCLSTYQATLANGLLVTAELGYTGSVNGMLRARTSGNAGTWENNTVSHVFTAANGSYVTTELDYTGSEYAMLRARPNQTSIGPWEKFFWWAG
jgi:hypothetical protein